MDLFSRLKDKKILLVDDDEWIRDSLTLYFSNEGCHMLAVEKLTPRDVYGRKLIIRDPKSGFPLPVQDKAYFRQYWLWELQMYCWQGS